MTRHRDRPPPEAHRRPAERHALIIRLNVRSTSIEQMGTKFDPVVITPCELEDGGNDSVGVWVAELEGFGEGTSNAFVVLLASSSRIRISSAS
jgi:hypothetical protein